MTGLVSILFFLSIISLVSYHLPDIISSIYQEKQKTEKIAPPYKEITLEQSIVIEEPKKEEKVESTPVTIVKPVVQPPTQEKKDTTPVVKDTIIEPIRDTVIKVIDSLSTP